jgi:hypothetical protein
MGRKKQVIEGNIMTIDDTPPPPQQQQPTIKEVKVKREITEKQRDNLRKGMMALKEKRKKLMDDEDVCKPDPIIVKEPLLPVKEPLLLVQPIVQPTVKPVRIKTVKPKVNYLTSEDFNVFKTDLFTQLNRPTPPIIVEKEKLVDKIIEKPIDRLVDRVVSGSALLDEIFFKRK